MAWGSNPLKLALRHIKGLFDTVSPHFPDGSSFIQGAKNPRWRRYLVETKLPLLPYTKALSIAGSLRSAKPTLITDRYWDHLIILDACRYDTFLHVWHTFFYKDPSTVSSIVSPGSHTREWVVANLVENPHAGLLRHVHLITANPYNSREFFDKEGWPFPLKDCDSTWKHGWDEDLDTVRPEMVVKAACSVLRSSPSSRLIIHLMQPHFPYLDQDKIPTDFREQDFRDPAAPGLWGMVKEGIVSLELVKSLYEENLIIALGHALKLVQVLSGKVVITSDHGNLFGEYGLLWHPSGLHVPELTMVPWLELRGEDGDPVALLEEADSERR